VINVFSSKSPFLYPHFDRARTIEIEDRPFAEGGFGRIHHWMAIDGRAASSFSMCLTTGCGAGVQPHHHGGQVDPGVIAYSDTRRGDMGGKLKPGKLDLGASPE